MPAKEAQPRDQVIAGMIEGAVFAQAVRGGGKGNYKPEAAFALPAGDGDGDQEERWDADVERRPLADGTGEDDLGNVSEGESVALCHKSQALAAGMRQILDAGEERYGCRA